MINNSFILVGLSCLWT